jgi:hypothetical protein
MCSRLSACPSWVRLCRICLFGLRLVRARFGYAESAFSVFGLSELGSAMPNLPFRSSACPSWVRLCRICLFGLRLVRHSSIIGIWLSCSNPKHRDFDHQVRSAYPTQSPNTCFYGFFVGFWFAQRGDIFSGRVPYFGFMPLSLFF